MILERQWNALGQIIKNNCKTELQFYHVIFLENCHPQEYGVSANGLYTYVILSTDMEVSLLSWKLLLFQMDLRSDTKLF